MADVRQDRQSAQIWENLAQVFDPFARNVGLLVRQSGDVAARSRQACDEAGADRVASQRKDNGDDRCRLLYCRDCASRRNNYIDLEPDELGRDLSVALGASLRPAILDSDGATLGPTEFAQPLHESSSPCTPDRSRRRAQEPDGRHLLLRVRRKRPSGRRAADQPNELAPPHHSITSSARASSVCGTVRPSAFAVLRLITSSYLVGACTGRSAGFSPLRMRST